MASPPTHRTPSSTDDSTKPNETATDSTLIILERARAGDRAAAQTLIERAVPPVKRWARGRVPASVRGEANTEDVLQDAVVNTLRLVSASRLKSVSGLQFYLRRSVMNRIRDLIRRTIRRGGPAALVDDVASDRPSPLESAVRAERLEHFLAALQRLTPADRQLVVWRVELGYSVVEIAQRLGKPVPTTAMRVSRALQRLKAALAANELPTQ